MAKNISFRKTKVCLHILPFLGSVTLGELPNISKPEFPHLKNGIIIVLAPKRIKAIHVRCFAW